MTSLRAFTRNALMPAALAAGLAPCPASATDPLAQPNWTTTVYGSIDPQIAAGPNHVVITQNTKVYFHSKSGTLVSSTTTRDLFKPLWDPANSPNINDGLDLPADAPCYRNFPEDMYVDTLGSDSYCLTDWYDARTLYDSFRDRFVIVALARNGAAKCGNNDDANLEARRTKLVIAYSATPDPTAGSWVFTVFDAVPGEYCATDSCRTAFKYKRGDAADYPVIGLHRNYLLVSTTHEGKPSTGVCIDDDDSDGSYPDLTATVQVFQADRLATGHDDSTTCMGLCSWIYDWEDLRHDNGGGNPANESQVKGWIPVANTHGSAYLGDAWFAVPVSGSRDKLNVWHFKATGSSTVPTLYRSTATLPRFDSVDRDIIRSTYPQPPIGTTPAAKLSLTFTRSLVMQDEYLYYADVGGMNNGTSTPDASIRLAGLVPSGTGNNVTFALNRSAIFHVNNEGYGSPALEVDEERTIVLTYSKFGVSASDPTSFTGFGARYITWAAGDSTVPGGRPLATNEASMPGDVRGKFDTAGISLAPGGRIYMMMPYVKAVGWGGMTWGYAVNYINP